MDPKPSFTNYQLMADPISSVTPHSPFSPVYFESHYIT